MLGHPVSTSMPSVFGTYGRTKFLTGSRSVVCGRPNLFVGGSKHRREGERMERLARQRLGFVACGVVSLGVTTTAIAPSAHAGAPNYECIAKGVRIGIDQHRSKALVRWDGHGTEAGSTKNGDQNGEHLGINVVVASGIWTLDVTGFGKAVTINGPAGKLRGTCSNVAGNLVLSRTTRVTTIRALGNGTRKAKAVLTVGKGAFVWNAGNVDPTNSTLGPKDQYYVTVVSGKPLPMNHMDVTGSQGWVPASAVVDVCAVENRKPGWDSMCK
jgi:hypothetical protein